MSHGTDPNTGIGKSLKTIEGMVSAFDKKLEDLIEVNNEIKLRKKAADILKAIGLITVFVCWIVEHITIANWVLRNEQFKDGKSQVLHDMLKSQADQLAVDQILVRRDSLQMDLNIFNKHLADVLIDNLIQNKHLDMLATLNDTFYSNAQLKTDTTGTADKINDIMFDFYYGKSSILKEKYAKSSQFDSSAQHKLNVVIAYEHGIRENIDRYTNYFIKIYFLGAFFLCLAWVFEKNWFDVERIWRKKNKLGAIKS